MNEKSTSNNIKNEDCNLNTEDSDFDNLISRLNEIKVTIALIEKQFLDKF